MTLGPVRDRRGRAVLLVDDEGWASFDQTAAALRRNGLRTIRVTASAPATLGELFSRWLADHLLYDELICLNDPKSRLRLAQLADDGQIADAVISEPILRLVGLDSDEGRLLVANSLAFRSTPASSLLDKFEVNRALEAAGVPVPRQIAGPCPPLEAAERLGLPLIIKNPTGAAGYGVRLARTLEEIEPAVAQLRALGQEPFFQACIEGPVVMYCAVLGPGGVPLIQHGFRVEHTQSHLGPSAAVSLYDRPELLAVGAQAAALFQPQGFAAFGFIEAADGRLLHIDANLRVWGNIASPLKLGINYLAAYAALLRGDRSPAAAPQAGSSGALNVYPYALFHAVRSSGWREIAAITGDFLKGCRPALGSRYCLQALIQAALLTRSRRTRAAAAPPTA